MNEELKVKINKFLKGVIFDYHNNNLNQAGVNEEVLNYMFDGMGEDSKFFENYVDFIDQNFIGREEIK